MQEEGEVQARDLVRIGWTVERGAKAASWLVIGVNDQGYEVVSRAFFNGLDYVTHPDAVEKVS